MPILMKQPISILVSPALDECECIRFISPARFRGCFVFRFFFRIKCIQENLLIICYLFCIYYLKITWGFILYCALCSPNAAAIQYCTFILEMFWKDGNSLAAVKIFNLLFLLFNEKPKHTHMYMVGINNEWNKILNSNKTYKQNPSVKICREHINWNKLQCSKHLYTPSQFKLCVYLIMIPRNDVICTDWTPNYTFIYILWSKKKN